MSDRKAFFEEHGYYVAGGVFAPEEVTRLEAEFDNVIQQLVASGAPYAGPNAGQDNGIISTVNVQQYSSCWLTHGILHPRFLDVAEEFMGPDIVLQHTSLYEKRMSDVVGPFRMHQHQSRMSSNRLLIAAICSSRSSLLSSARRIAARSCSMA